MKTRHVLLFILLLILSTFTLSSCHKKREREIFKVPDTFDENKVYEISFWAKNDSNVSQKEIYNQTINDFMEIYPNIHVTLKSYTDYTKIYNDVITNIQTNTTPNVCITYPDHVATYMAGDNVMVALDELIGDSKYGLGGSLVKYDSVKKDEIVESFLNECYIGEQLYLLPFMRSSEATYINKDYVNSLGYEVPDILTWDFIFEVSVKAMEQKQANQVLIPFIYKSTDNMMIQMLKQKNIPYSNSDGEIFMFNNDTASIVLDIYDVAKTGAFSTFKISSYPGNYFNAGQCIFAIDSTAGATWIGTDAPLMDIPEEEVISFETVVRPVPQYDVDNPKMISQGPSLCLFNKDDEGEVLASWLFMQYLLTNGPQIAYSETEGYVPVTLKAQNTDEYQTYLASSGIDNDKHYSVKIDVTKLILNNIDNTFVTPVFRGSASLRDAAGYLVEQATNKAKIVKMDEDYVENTIFADARSLYRIGLDSRTTYSKLPVPSIVLLILLAFSWLFFLYFIIYNGIIIKRKEKKTKGDN